MYRFIFKKTITSILAFLIMFILLYFFINGVVGVPIKRGSEFVSDAQWQAELVRLGLDKSIWERFLSYVTNIFKGDFGVVYSTSQSNVSNLFFERLGNSMLIVLPSFGLGMIIGIPFGYWAAYRLGKAEDMIISGAAMLFIVSPIFVLACYTLLLAPLLDLSTTFVPIAKDKSLIETIKSLIMPVVIVTLFSSSYWTIYTKSDVAKVNNTEFVASARAIGLSEWKIFKSYLFRNSISNFIKLITPIFLLTLTSSVIIENIFGMSGLSSLIAYSIEFNEINIILFVSYFFVMVGIVSDLIFSIIYFAINPLLMTSLKTKNATIQKMKVKKIRSANEIHEYALQLRNSLGGDNE